MCTTRSLVSIIGLIFMTFPKASIATGSTSALQSLGDHDLAFRSRQSQYHDHNSRAVPTSDGFNLDPNEDQGYDGDPLPSSSTSASPSDTVTASDGTPSCSYHGPDPDGFSPEGWCVCGSSTTLPLISVTSTPAPESASCDYSTIPPVTASVSKSIPPATTSDCMVYQQVGANEDNDTEVPGCIPTGRPTTNVTISKNKVAAGNLTGPTFYGQILRILQPKCHDVVDGNGTCDSTGAQIDKVSYVEKDLADLESGSVTFTIENAIYRTNEQRDAMLQAVAFTFNASAQGKNCGAVSYNDCKGGGSEPSDVNSASSPGSGCGVPITMCNLPNLVSVNLLQGGVEVGVMIVWVSFKINGWTEFDCQIVADIIDAFYGVAEAVAPETAPADTALIIDMEAVCAELGSMNGGGGGVSSTSTRVIK